MSAAMPRSRFPYPVALLLGALVLAGFVLSTAPVFAQDETTTVDLVEVTGIIDPTVADYLAGRRAAAEASGVQAVMVQLDTPGGLDASMRDIIRQMLGSGVPVIVWIAPRGARAASAGTFITYAANLSYMAEATELGAATPVDLGGGEMSETMARKITNDAVALIREMAVERGRDAHRAEAPVREAGSIGAW